jgi:hypothetical protein
MSRSFTIALASLVLVALALGQVPYTMLDQSPSLSNGPNVSVDANEAKPQIETSEIECQPRISNSASHSKVAKLLGQIHPDTWLLVALTSIRNAPKPAAAALGALTQQTGTRLLI